MEGARICYDNHACGKNNYLNLLPDHEFDESVFSPSSHVGIFQFSFSQIEMHFHSMVVSASLVHLFDAPRQSSLVA